MIVRMDGSEAIGQSEVEDLVEVGHTGAEALSIRRSNSFRSSALRMAVPRTGNGSGS